VKILGSLKLEKRLVVLQVCQFFFALSIIHRYSGAEVEPAHFLMHVLKIISNLGFQLDAAVPLLRRGQLGIRSSREILVFKGSNPG
jgi:hypothetical protein